MVLSAHGTDRKWWKTFCKSPFFEYVVADLDIDLTEEDLPDLIEGDVVDGDEEAASVERARGSKDPAPPIAETRSKPRSVAQSNDELRRVMGAPRQHDALSEHQPRGLAEIPQA